MDLDSLLIAAAEPTPANVDETTVADRLLSGRERERRYAERGIECAIMRRGSRHLS